MPLTAFLSKASRLCVINKSCSSFNNTIIRHSQLWTPDYLHLRLTKTPEYDYINVQLKSYDFAVLEKFQSLVYKLAKHMKINVENCWATPCQDLLVKKFKPKSSVAETNYNLKVYERNVQVVDVKSHIMPLFLDALMTSCPPGVNISVHEHTNEIEMDRYIPDLEAEELKKQLTEMNKKK